MFGLLGVTRAVLPHMRRQRSGHIINLSSVGGYAGYPGWGVYGATKFAVEGISEALAGEVAPLGIKVTVVEPGFFRTDFLDETSLARTAQHIDDYRESVGNTRAHAADVNHGQRGDPRKLASAFIALVNAKKPPLRLPLGSDTVERIEAKNAFVAEELAEWRTRRDLYGFHRGSGVSEKIARFWLRPEPGSVVRPQARILRRGRRRQAAS